MLQDPWTKRHPIICRFLLIPVSLVVLLAVLTIPAVDPQIRSIYSGTISMQFTVFSTMLFIRILPVSEDTLHIVIQTISLFAVFAIPQLMYWYYFNRKPRESQAIWMFIGIYIVAIVFHAQLCKERFGGVMQVYNNGNPISEKDLYKNIGKPMYWRRDYQFNDYGYYTNGSLVTYITRNKKGHFEVNSPHQWINSANAK